MKKISAYKLHQGTIYKKGNSVFLVLSNPIFCDCDHCKKTDAILTTAVISEGEISNVSFEPNQKLICIVDSNSLLTEGLLDTSI